MSGENQHTHGYKPEEDKVLYLWKKPGISIDDLIKLLPHRTATSIKKRIERLRIFKDVCSFKKQKGDENDMELKDFKRRRNNIQVIDHITNEKKVKLVPVGDLHLGAPTCNIEKFLGTIDYIKKSGALVILMGDLMEAASKHSVSSGWVDQEIKPQDQLDLLCEVLEPIKGQILCLIEGNHEFRIWNEVGIRVAKIMASKLGVPFVGYSCFVRLKVQKQNYVIYAQHGSSGAMYGHTKMAAVKRTAQHTEADIYLYAHVHELAAESQSFRKLDLRSRTVKYSKKQFVITGHFLEYENSYAERKNYFPGKTGVAKLTFLGNRRDCHIST